MRKVLGWTISASMLMGCSLFVSLDGLSGPESAGDAGLDSGDAASGDATARDGQTGSDAGDGSTSLTYAETVLLDSPVAYWRLDDTGSTAADETKNAIDGVYHAAASVGASGLLSDPSDKAVSFIDSAAGASLTIPANDKLEVTTGLSVELWFRPSGTDPHGEMASYGPQASAPFQPWDLQINNAGSDFRILFYTSAVGTLMSSMTIEVDKTYYLVGTFDGANLRIYLNGTLDSVGGNAGAFSNYDHDAGLGIGSGFLGDFPFLGVLDEIAVYDHPLAPARIAAHYAAGTR